MGEYRVVNPLFKHGKQFRYASLRIAALRHGTRPERQVQPRAIPISPAILTAARQRSRRPECCDHQLEYDDTEFASFPKEHDAANAAEEHIWTAAGRGGCTKFVQSCGRHHARQASGYRGKAAISRKRQPRKHEAELCWSHGRPAGARRWQQYRSLGCQNVAEIATRR